MLIIETDKMLTENQEGNAELDLEKLKLFDLRIRQGKDKVVQKIKTQPRKNYFYSHINKNLLPLFFLEINFIKKIFCSHFFDDI